LFFLKNPNRAEKIIICVLIDRRPVTKNYFQLTLSPPLQSDDFPVDAAQDGALVDRARSGLRALREYFL